VKGTVIQVVAQNGQFVEYGRRFFLVNHERDRVHGSQPGRDRSPHYSSLSNLGIETVAAVSEADRESLAAKMANARFASGRRVHPIAISNRTLVAPRRARASMPFIRLGFLSERAELAQACADNKITFIVPAPRTSPTWATSWKRAKSPFPAGTGQCPLRSRQKSAPKPPLRRRRRLSGAAQGLRGAVRGSSWSGNRARCRRPSAPRRRTRRPSQRHAYMERYIGNARHIESRLLGDRSGNVIHLASVTVLCNGAIKKSRGSSRLRRSTKVRDQICHAAATLARSIGLSNAGTVEFIFDNDTHEFFFLEMNTRIQVEHPVTEMITGVDLVHSNCGLRAANRCRLSNRCSLFRSRHRMSHQTPSRRSMNFVLPDGSPTGRDRRAAAFGWIPTAIPVTSSRPSTIHSWQS